MFEALQYTFMQRALLAGLLISAVSSYYGVFVVQRKLSFLGNGLAHAAFGGVAAAIYLQQFFPALEPLWVAVPFTIVVAVAIQWVQQHTKLASDTAIGILFSVAMALGVIFLSLTSRYSTDAMAYLFGSIVMVNPSDLMFSGLVALLTVCTLPYWGRWAYATMDSELARADGLKTSRDNYLLTIFLAITIVVAMKVVGIVLVGAFAVVPAATARLISRRFSSMTVASVLIGVFSVVIGLPASYQLNLPSGACIILLQAIVFFIVSFLPRER